MERGGLCGPVVDVVHMLWTGKGRLFRESCASCDQSEWDSVAVICDSSCGETQMDGRAMLSRQCQSSNWVSSELLKRYQTAQRYRYHASDSFLRRRTMFAIMETVSRKNNQVMRWTPPWGRKATSVPVSAMTMATCRLHAAKSGWGRDRLFPSCGNWWVWTD